MNISIKPWWYTPTLRSRLPSDIVDFLPHTDGQKPHCLFSWLSCTLVLILIVIVTPSRTALAQQRESIKPTALKNGLSIYVRERRATPLVAIDLWIEAGSREERTEEFGSAHFLEHLLFKGTTSRSVGEVDRDIENLGGTLNAATGPDYVHFYTTIKRDYVPKALEIVADMVQNATLPDNELNRERGVILDELAEHNTNPGSQLVDLLYSTSFEQTNTPYRHTPGGTTDTISLRNRDTLASFYARNYHPNRACLVLVGALTPEEGAEWANIALGNWKAEAPRNVDQRRDAPTPQPISAPKISIRPSPDSNTHVGIAYPAPSAQDPVTSTAAQLVAEMLGRSGRYGRLGTLFRSDSVATVRYTPRRDNALWIATLSYRETKSESNTTPRRVPPSAEILKLQLLDAIKTLSTNPPSQRELNRAQSSLLARIDQVSEKNADVANAIGFAHITRAEPIEAQRLRVTQVSLQDLHHFINAYLTQPIAISILDPATPKP